MMTLLRQTTADVICLVECRFDIIDCILQLPIRLAIYTAYTCLVSPTSYHGSNKDSYNYLSSKQDLCIVDVWFHQPITFQANKDICVVDVLVSPTSYLPQERTLA